MERALHKVTVQATLTHYGDVDVVIASDEDHRSFVGVPLHTNGRASGAFLFIEIDRITVLEMARDEVDLYTVMTERGVGLVFETQAADAELKTPPAARALNGGNRRSGPRKVLRQSAQVTHGDSTMQVSTWDLGTDGMCLVTPRPIQPGTRCQVTFDVPLPDGTHTVTADVRVVYSSYSGPAQFKVGTVFSELDDGAEGAITEFSAL